MPSFILKYEYNKEAELSREETETRIMAKDILDKVNNGFKLFKKYKNEDGETKFRIGVVGGLDQNKDEWFIMEYGDKFIPESIN